MFGAKRQNDLMWCRMRISRAGKLAGAASMRLVTVRCK